MGIRRISFGLQTTDFSVSPSPLRAWFCLLSSLFFFFIFPSPPPSLKMAKKLGRDDVDYVRAAVDNVRAAGFKSLNIDLM
jgi:hypothetical protein